MSQHSSAQQPERCHTSKDLFSNSLSGHIPVELGNPVFPLCMKNTLSASFIFSSKCTISHLLIPMFPFVKRNLDDNDLEGNLPEELGKLRKLENLYLSSNKFNGSIPATYAQLVNLQVFVVGGNYLSGKIPNYFGKWVNLTKLILIGNNFKGNLPAETFSLPKLQILLVSDVSNPAGIYFPNVIEVMPGNLNQVVLRNCNIWGQIPEYIGRWRQLMISVRDLSFNNLTGRIPDSFQNTISKLFLTNNWLDGLPSWNTSKQNRSPYPETYLSYNNFTEDCTDSKCLGLERVHIFLADNSLFINCGGEEVTLGKARYLNDTSTSDFFRSPNDDWAYSYSGDYLWAKINDSTLVRNSTCEVSSPEAKLDNNFRLAPVSLTYYGLCLSNGKYHVTLHFAETLYSKGEDNSRVGKRVFDVYIQKERVEKDLNIKEALRGQNEELKKQYTTKIRDGSLEIHIFWTGKGSLYNPPAINGPLISAISVTRVPRKLRPWEIAVIAVSCILFLLLMLAFMWRMGWIGDRELRETKVKIGGKPFTLKQIIDATRNFSPENELGRGRSGIVYKADLPNLTVAVKKLDPKSKAVDEIASEVYAKKALDVKHDNVVTLLASYSKRHLHLLIYEYMKHGSLGQVQRNSIRRKDLQSARASKLHAKQVLEQLVYTRLGTSSERGQASIALNLAIMCTDQSPSLRPTMSQVVAVLERSKTLEDISKEINTSE
uniref:non-specific serine/threonine protein kinase n=1 Tax=Populus alba TaxID=43335 RepID=A0A4U5QLU0_POPAL|nr:putative LRR receptor-like serine/threonine-protein kinase [Populus alba]